MKFKYTIGVLLGLGSILSSCEDFLTIAPKGELTEENVFGAENSADLFLNDIYVTLPNPEIAGNNGRIHGFLTYDNWDWMSPYNVCKFNWGISSQLYLSHSYTAGTYNPGIYNHGYPSVNFEYDWITPYIRNCNFFIESVEKYKANFSEEWAVKRVAEAKCLRAYHYHHLWMNYGGVPYLTKVLNNNTMGDKIFQPSMSQKEMYEHMTQDLKEAAEDLPNEQGLGRFTKGAALTLKAWIELYWGDIIKDPRPKAIFPADPQQAKAAYAACAATCQEILGLGVYDLMPTREQAFMEQHNNCKEQVLAYQCNSTFPTSQRSMVFAPFNPFIGNPRPDIAGTSQPTQALVDMYCMANGLPITDPNSGYDPEHPYEGREPRFYEDIVYDGAVFGGYKYTFTPTAGQREVGLVPDPNCFWTGYFRRKGVNDKLDGTTFATEACNFSFFRYAEVYLMYAEARIKEAQLGGRPIDNSVIDALDKVRMRPATANDKGLPSLRTTYGGMPTLDQLAEIIYAERIVELSFEFKAYNDVIRFRRGDLMAKSKMAMRRGADGKYFQQELLKGSFNDDKLYLMPIFQGWLENNPVWMNGDAQVDGRVKGQNPGW